MLGHRWMDGQPDRSCLISSSVIWSRQWTVVSLRLQVTLRLKAGWRDGPTGNCTKSNKAKHQVPQLERPAEAVRAGDCLSDWGADLQKCPRRGGRQWAGHEPSAEGKAARKTNSIPGCISRVTALLREGVIHLYSAFVRARLHTVQVSLHVVGSAAGRAQRSCAFFITGVFRI